MKKTILITIIFTILLTLMVVALFDMYKPIIKFKCKIACNDIGEDFEYLTFNLRGFRNDLPDYKNYLEIGCKCSQNQEEHIGWTEISKVTTKRVYG